MRKCIVFAFLLCTLMALAHRENDIVYTFEGDMLTIHMTPKTVIDLLLENRVIDSVNIDINKHHKFFTTYFNDKIDVQVSGKRMHFDFMKSKFTSHEGIMVFKTDIDINTSSIFEIDISCFLEIYNRPTNMVKWILESATKQCFLDKKTTSCTIYNNISPKKKNIMITLSFIFLTALILSVTAFLFFQKRKKRT